MTFRRPSSRRCFVLLAVLVIVGISLLVATGVLFIVQSRSADSVGTAEAAQARALAWSGVQIVMFELGSQRERLLNAEHPQLNRQYEVYDTQFRMGVVRLLPMNAGGDRLFDSECGKLDLHSIDADTLARIGEPFITLEVARTIVAYRDQTLGRPFQSIAELLNVPGITPAMVYGPIEDIKPHDQAQLTETLLSQRVLERLLADEPRGLADILTVFNVDPELQHSGQPRINLNQAWSEMLERQITDRFDANAARQTKELMARVKFENDAAIVQALRETRLSPDAWGELLDAFKTSEQEIAFDRLDINSARAEAIQTLPTITPEQAIQIVNARENMSADDLRSVAWPVVAQILSPEQFQQLHGKITNRSLVYRVRLAAGEVDSDEPTSALVNPVIYEAVLDLSGPSPRLAYFRDITLLQPAVQLALEASQLRSGSEEPIDEDASSHEDEIPVVEASRIDSSFENVNRVTPPKVADESEARSPPEPAPRRAVGRWLGGH